jgi:tRNA modification GTPase
MEKDTIAAISTAVGESAIGIVKISGTKSIKIADKIFLSHCNRKIREMGSFTIAYGKIINDDGSIIDEVIISLMKAPKSYTTEDVVEINCHGGIAATNRVLDLCIRHGARLAEPGEFTKRAFLNGRIDLSQAEAISDIIMAKTSESLKIATKNLEGNVKREIEKLRENILDVMTELEAAVDFIEEDLQITPYDELKNKSLAILDEIRLLIKNEKLGEIIKNGIRIAIVGKPNVGKSSILNAIIKKEKAIVTPLPGTTRDAVEELIYIKGIPVIMTDTAGIRKTKNQIEKIGVQKSKEHIRGSDLIIMVFDNSINIEKTDLEIFESIKEKEKIIILNKNDLKKLIDLEILDGIKKEKIIKMAAVKNIGINELEEEIIKKVVGEKRINIDEKIIVNKRQKIILEKAKNLIISAVKSMDANMSEEFPAADLRGAYTFLGEILGKTYNEDILNNIFQKFCIGK